MRSILLLPRVSRCLETIDVYMWHMFAFMSVVVTVCLYCEVWSCMCSYMGSCMGSCMGGVNVSSCRCMFVSCVHPVAVLNARFA